jgi:hypothetical protein
VFDRVDIRFIIKTITHTELKPLKV